MTDPNICVALDELLSRLDWTRGDIGLSDDELLDLIGLGDLRPILEAMPDTPITFTAHDGDPSDMQLHIEYEPADE